MSKSNTGVLAATRPKQNQSRKHTKTSKDFGIPKDKPIIQSIFNIEPFEEQFADGMKLDIAYETKEEEPTYTLQPMDNIMSSNSKIFAKRKSESWNSKPLEKFGNQDLAMDDLYLNTFDSCYTDLFSPLDVSEHDLKFEPMNMFPPPLPQAKQEEENKNKVKRTHIGMNEFDFADLPNLFGEEIIPTPSVQISTTRKSEDWSYKPKLKRAKSMPIENGDVKRRLKWSHEELTLLWRGILKEGNNWKEISKALQSRSYFQIKDKGRRLLFLRGWTTGRNKNDTDDGNRKAKEIARYVLAEMRA